MNYTKVWTCPYCGSNKYHESDYECVVGQDGNHYQHYDCICKDCGHTFYNVARYIGALTKEQFNDLIGNLK